MEQRIGSNNQPLAAAAVDPSHIPGLTAPVSVKKEKQEEPEDIKPTEPVEPDEAAPERNEPAAAEPSKPSLDKSPAGKTPADADETDAEDDTEANAEADAPADAETEAGADTEDGAADGPVFEASDRRAKIIADSRGVRLRLDDQECEFGWDEIGAIETESPRFGKRFTITVHTPDRRWYFLEIEAKAKSEHAVWEKQIDEVLDAYFDEGSAESSAEGSAEEEQESEDTAS
ncbi:hypothetical protein QBB34_15800 [Streptomyces stelliscabiei]|uniref:hypothetical protein n=1 Tax=Streptomyces stelliscabiei TaxID=146820 RepID=UPI002FEF0584